MTPIQIITVSIQAIALSCALFMYLGYKLGEK
jgi:hypothetical protein